MANEEPRPPSLAPPQESPPQQVYLTGLGQDIKRHWEQFLPRMSADLKRKRQFLQAVYAAQELVGESLYDLVVRRKVEYNQAWEMVRDLAFFPSEEDQPENPALTFERPGRPPGPPPPEAPTTALPTPTG